MRTALGTASAAVVILGLVMAGGGCAGPGPDPDDPGFAALRIFAVASSDRSREKIASIFDPESLDPDDVSLLEALDEIPRCPSPAVLRVERSPGNAEAFVDLAVELPGEGRAVYSVKLRRLEPEDWRIAWFQGPGVEWPPRGGTGPGLTTSAPPRSSSDD